jgi:hypothetical protein
LAFLDNLKSLSVRLDDKELLDKVPVSSHEKTLFDNAIEGMVCYNDVIEINGRIRQVIDRNIFSAIATHNFWNKARQMAFRSYVLDKYGTIHNFNETMAATKTMSSINRSIINFDHPQFNLVFVNVNNSYLECYAKENPTNKKVKYISCSTETRFYVKIIQYLREIVHFEPLIMVAKNERAADALQMELNKGKYILNKPIKLISNSPNTYCFAYFNLNKLNPGGAWDAWQSFINNFQTELMAKQFMAWVYGIFVEEDKNRQVLWIEGVGMSGKSTVVRAIGIQLLRENAALFKTIAEQGNNDFALEEMENCHLAVFAEGNEQNFFKRRDILTMTGGDYVNINRKHKQVISKRLQVKVIVHSNYSPKVNKEYKHETTRLLHVKLDADKCNPKNFKEYSNGFEDALDKQFFNFLAQCKQHYYNLKNKEGLIGNGYS